MINSKMKGKIGELEWVHFCQHEGFTKTRRTAQYCGNTGEASDCVGLPGIHQEVKRVEKLNINDAFKQAVNDANEKDIPMVAHRKNRHQWLVTMSAKAWFELYAAWLKSIDKKYIDSITHSVSDESRVIVMNETGTKIISGSIVQIDDNGNINS